MVAHRQKDVGEGVVVNDTAVEKILKVRRKPHEEKELAEAPTVSRNGRLDTVLVNSRRVSGA